MASSVVRIFPTIPDIDVKLENIRSRGLANKFNNDELCQALLSLPVHFIHASYLFDVSKTCASEALKELCLQVSSSQLSHGGWEDLLARLELDTRYITLIEKYKIDDFTALTLQIYAHNPRKVATIGKIIEVLQSLKRYDAILKAFPHLIELVYLALKEENMVTFTESKDPNSNSEASPTALLCPPALVFESLNQKLFFTFKDVGVDGQCSLDDLLTSSKLVQRTPHVNSNQKYLTSNSKLERKPILTVMMTFSEDGLQTAHRVETLFKKKGIGVLVLDNLKEKIQQNPTEYIKHNFARVDYIVPILTLEYLTSLCSNPPSFCTSLDFKHIKFIHDMMSLYYIRNGGFNDKIRCIIPDDQITNVMKHKLMDYEMPDPVFQAWEKASKTEELADRLIRNKKRHV